VIRELPPHVVARIAAGEVIERPASVVKELVENSLDAGARTIEVELSGGGIDLTRVSDDGQGIRSDQVELAFRRYATSKIRSDADLRSLSTLGFRGEALPSIAAVARVNLATRHSNDVTGTALTFEDGQLTELRPIGRANGTSVAVSDLFGRLPARRKFLRPRVAEAAAALQVVSQYALAYPEVAFRVQSDGREVLRAGGDGERRSAVLAVLGPEVARDLVDLPPRTAKDHARLFAAVTGLVGRQWLHRANRSAVCVYINRRLVQHRGLLAALERAYETLLPVGRHPVAILDITVPPDEADFNVHPAKAEVRLLRERAVASLVYEAVQDALATEAGVAGWGGAAQAGESDHLGELRVIGQAGGTYIVAEGMAGVYLVDQHAAHERVLLEELRERGSEDGGVQLLLEPQVIELSPHQAAMAAQHMDDLTGLGFVLELFGPRSLLLRGVPLIAGERDPTALLRATLDGATEHTGPSDWRERLAVSLSCHTAVRAGDALTREEMQALLTRLGEAELCRTCSHGRPTAILLSLSQLEREFGRR
jgi:DNA mismatch repair protein MutL